MHQPTTFTPAPRRLLHVGCGYPNPERVPRFFRAAQWREIRFDIDANVHPDIIGTILDMAEIPTASMDAIWSSHNLEHLNWFEVPTALAEFQRVLKPNGFALITVPDLRAVARHIVADEVTTPLYHSSAGPISALDMVFGHQDSIKHGNQFMAHRTGFTASMLGKLLADAGFHEARVHEGGNWDLWAIATMPETRPDVFIELAGVML